MNKWCDSIANMSQCIFHITSFICIHGFTIWTCWNIIKSIEILLFFLANEQTEDRVSVEKLEELGIVLWLLLCGVNYWCKLN